MADETQPVTTPEQQPVSEDAAAPVVADLDAALAKAQADYEASRRTEPEPQAAPTQDAADPDDEPTAEAADGEPASDPTDEVPDEAQEPAEKETGKPSRQQRYLQKQIDEAVQAALAERQRADAAERELQLRQQEDARLLEEVAAAAGTAEEIARLRQQYDALSEKGLRDGDVQASDEALAVKTKLDGMLDAQKRQRAAERVADLRAQANLEQQYQGWKGYPGVDAAFLEAAPSLQDAGKHLYEAGKAESERTWKARYERMEADYQAKLARSAGKAPALEPGGRSAGGGSRLAEFLGPDGLPTDEAMARFNNGTLDYTSVR